MPELPEVETVRRAMVPVMEGQRLSEVILRRADLRIPFPKDLTGRLEGSVIQAIRRRSKYILMDTNRGDVVLMHLGMSGKVMLFDPNMPRGTVGKHDHVEWRFDKGGRMVFADPRRFGMLTLFRAEEEAHHRLLEHIGPEPLSNAFSQALLEDAFARRKSPVKSVLLDQKTVAGLGNIYVCEALWRSGIAPQRQACDVKTRDIGKLHAAIRDVLEEAIASGGSTLRDHIGISGELGYFQHHFDVYGREGERCHRSECDGVIERIVQSGRSSFHCGHCQT